MIWIEDTKIKVGNVILPGLFKSLEITEEAEIEEQEVEGSSTKKKQAMGYEDAKINIEIILEDGEHETKYYKLQKVQNLFKKSGQEKPIVYNIVSDQLAVRNISKVLFKTLSSKEDNGKSSISVSLVFWAYDAMTVTATQTSTSTSTVAKTTTAAAKTTTASTIATAKRSRSYQRGTAISMISKAKKKKKTPAKDNKDTNYLLKHVRVK